MDLLQIYFKKLNKLAVITNFLAFFCFIWNFFPPGLMQIRIHSPESWQKIKPISALKPVKLTNWPIMRIRIRCTGTVVRIRILDPHDGLHVDPDPGYCGAARCWSVGTFSLFWTSQNRYPTGNCNCVVKYGIIREILCVLRLRLPTLHRQVAN